jgi:nucleoporin POM152
MCKATVTDLRFDVHPLPSASVAHGRKMYQDIHEGEIRHMKAGLVLTAEFCEGDQAEIIFELSGTPPFTFTYQRSEPPLRKGGRLGKVLETHTVTGVSANQYSIFTASEGNVFPPRRPA